MDIKTLLKLEAIQGNLSAGIGMINVIADGLSCYTSDSSLSGNHALKYVNALIAVYEKLSAAAGELGETLDRLKPDSNTAGAA